MSTFEAEITIGGQKKKITGSTVLAPILLGLEQLKSFRRYGSKKGPEELEWEIRLYEWILAQPDPEAAARKYADARDFGKGGVPKPKRQVVRELGWVIP